MTTTWDMSGAEARVLSPGGTGGATCRENPAHPATSLPRDGGAAAAAAVEHGKICTAIEIFGAGGARE
jgi:hypothetical protein